MIASIFFIREKPPVGKPGVKPASAAMKQEACQMAGCATVLRPDTPTREVLTPCAEGDAAGARSLRVRLQARDWKPEAACPTIVQLAYSVCTRAICPGTPGALTI